MRRLLHTHRLSTPGVYGVPGLHSPASFPLLASSAMQHVSALIADLQLATPSEATVETLDDISDAVCSVVDAAELCRNTHPSVEWQAAADGTVRTLHSFVAQLNAHSGLYAPLCAAQASASFSAEGARVAASLRTEFERGGIHLAADKREALALAQAQAVDAGLAFSRSLGRAPLRRLLCARADAAQLLGFDSYAALATEPLLARTPAAPLAFCAQLAAGLAPRARAELAALEAHRATASDSQQQLLVRARAQLCTAADARAASKFFTVHSVIAGLTLLCERLFGVLLRDVPLSPGEAWAPGVRKLEARHSVEGPLGWVYLDLRSRPRKQAGAAHYVLRAGRARGGVLPRVALVACLGEGDSCSLPHSAVEVLHHELGHALHSLLSRTHFQHLSGTRGSADVVEAPSTLLERLAWEPGAVGAWARAADGQPLPPKLLGRLSAARRAFAATDALQQVVHSATDLALHSCRSGQADEAFVQRCAVEAVERHTPWPPEPPGGHLLRLGHLVGYGSVYYSYLYGRALSGAAFRTLGLGTQPLGRAAGERLWAHLLRPGGSAEAGEAFGALLGEGALVTLGAGRAPCPQAALQDILGHA